MSMLHIFKTSLIHRQIVCEVTALCGLVYPTNNFFVSLRISSVTATYVFIDCATHNFGFSLNNGRISSGCERPGPDVFINCGILISTLSSSHEIFCTSIRLNVCAQCAVANANKVIVFKVTCFKERDSNGCHFSKVFSTTLVSHVVSYLGHCSHCFRLVVY